MSDAATPSVVCIGAACVDRLYRCNAPVHAATSNPARVSLSYGGVARNVAEHLARLGIAVALCSAVGDDEEGRALLLHLRNAGCNTEYVRVVAGERTAEYAALIGPDGELFAGACDARVLETLREHDVDAFPLRDAAWVLVDCNLPSPLIETCIERRSRSAWRLAIDGTSNAKVLALPARLSNVDLLFLNEAELAALGDRGARVKIVSRGALGVRILRNGTRVELPAVVATPVDVTGAGDALVAGTLCGLLGGGHLEDAVRYGLQRAARAVEHYGAMPR